MDWHLKFHDNSHWLCNALGFWCCKSHKGRAKTWGLFAWNWMFVSWNIWICCWRLYNVATIVTMESSIVIQQYAQLQNNKQSCQTIKDKINTQLGED